jgi:integrase/recombinase XerD
VGVQGQPEGRDVPKNLYTRNGVYWARFKVRGVEYRESLRTRSERVAAKRLIARMEEVADQAVFGIAGPVSWPDAVVSWNEGIGDSLGDKTFKRYAVSLRQLRGWLDDKAIHEVNAELLKDIVKDRKRAGVKNATIRRDLTALSSVLNHAVDEGWVADNAALAINRRRIVPERVVRIVLPQEATMILLRERLSSRLWDMCEFTREHGLRLDEVTNLRRTAVDRIERTITVENGKGEKVRTVALTARGEAILDRQPAYIGKPWAFWQGKGERITGVSSRIGGYMRRLAQKAAREGTEFEPFSHHDMRHLFAVEFLRRGRGSIYDLQAEMGHDSISTTERYLAFLTPEQAKLAKHGVSQRAAQEQRSGDQPA